MKISLKYFMHALYNTPIIISSLIILTFFIPFGSWQEIFIGITIPKLVIPVVLILLIAFRWKELEICPETTILALFVLSTITAFMHTNTQFLHVFIVLCAYVIFCNIIYNSIRTDNYLKYILQAYYTGFVIVVGLIMMAFAGVDFEKYTGRHVFQYVYGFNRLIGTEANPNAFGVFFIPVMPIILFYLFKKSYWVYKALNFLLFFILLIFLMLTLSRGAFIAAILACAASLYFGYRQPLIRLSIICILPFAVYFGVIFPKIIIDEYPAINLYINTIIHHDDEFEYEEKLSIADDKETASKNRIEALLTAYKLIKVNWLTGIGFNETSQAMYMQGFNDPIKIHNTYISILLEFGVFAFLTIIILFIYILFKLLKTVISEINDYKRQMYSLVFGIVFGLMSFGLFHEFYISIQFWLFLAIAMTIPKIKLSGQSTV